MPTTKKRPARTKMGGRYVYTFDRDLMSRICWDVASGKSLKQAMEDSKHSISYKTVFQWMDKFPEAAEMMAKARLLSSFSLEDRGVAEATMLLDKENLDSAKVRAVDVALNQLRWTAGKRNPQVFSDKLPPRITMGISITTPLDLGSGEGHAEIPNVYTIEMEEQDVEVSEAPRKNQGSAPRLLGPPDDERRRQDP